MSKSGALVGVVVVALGIAGAAAGIVAPRPVGDAAVQCDTLAAEPVPDCSECCDSAICLPDTIRLRIIGDVMLHRGQLEEAVREDSSYVFDTYLEGIRQDLMDADLSIANMEFSLGGKPYSGYPRFSAPDSYADYVAGCGVDVFLMANNHIVDRDTSGLHRTLEYYDSLGVFHTGIRNIADTLCTPLYLDVRGVKLAIVNFTYGTNLPNKSGEVSVNRMRRSDVLGAVSEARDSADLVLALPHWGVEYELKHSAEQQRWARELAEAGADVIVGAHPHVVQDSCVIAASDGRMVPVYYSIGNAVSNMSARYTQLELMVCVEIVRGDPLELSVSHEWLWCTRPWSLGRSYKTIRVSDCAELYPRSSWIDPSAFDRMEWTFAKVRDSLYNR